MSTNGKVRVVTSVDPPLVLSRLLSWLAAGLVPQTEGRAYYLMFGRNRDVGSPELEQFGVQNLVDANRVVSLIESYYHELTGRSGGGGCDGQGDRA